jgi:hypothetical protein
MTTNPLVDAYRMISTMNGWKWETATQGVPTVETYGGRIASGEQGKEKN